MGILYYSMATINTCKHNKSTRKHRGQDESPVASTLPWSGVSSVLRPSGTCQRHAKLQ